MKIVDVRFMEDTTRLSKWALTYGIAHAPPPGGGGGGGKIPLRTPPPPGSLVMNIATLHTHEEEEEN